MNTTAGVGMIACPSCSAGNGQTAKFCGSCGLAMGAQAAPPPVQPPPFPPHSRFNVGGMGAMSAGVNDIQSIAPMDLAQTFDHVGQTVMALGGRVLMQSPPTSMQIEFPYKNIWYTGGMAIRYRGVMTFTPQGANQTLLQAKLAVDWNSAGLLCALILVIGVFAGMLNPYFFMMSVIFAAVCAGVTAWMMTSLVQRRAADKLLSALSGAPVASAAPKFDLSGVPGMGGGNPFQKAQQPQQQQATAPAAEPSPIEQLERLAKLKDAGILTVEEFEAKKAEIMKRI